MISKFLDCLKNKRKADVIIFLICLLTCLIFSVSLKEEVVSRTQADESYETDSIEFLPCFQSFIPQYGCLKAVSIDIGKKNGRANSGVLTLTLYDQELNEKASVNIDVEDMIDFGLTKIETDWNVNPGEPAFLGISCSGSTDMAPVLHYRTKDGNAPDENLDFYYGPTVIENATANISYTYAKPLGLRKTLYLSSGIALIGLFISLLIKNGNKQN